MLEQMSTSSLVRCTVGLLLVLFVHLTKASVIGDEDVEPDLDSMGFGGDPVDEDEDDRSPGSALTRVSELDELHAFINPPEVVFGGGIVGIFGAEGSDDLKNFVEFVRPLDGNGFRVAVSVASKPIMAHFSVKSDAWKIYVYPPPQYVSEAHGDKFKFRFGGNDIQTDTGRSAMKEFFLKNYLPLASRISPVVGNERLFVERLLPVFVVISKIDEENDQKGVLYILNRLRKVGQKFRGRMTFAVLDKEDAESTLRFPKRFFVPEEGKAEKMDKIVGIKDGKRYFTMDGSFSVETSVQFIESFFAGKLKESSYQEDVMDIPEDHGPYNTDEL